MCVCVCVWVSMELELCPYSLFVMIMHLVVILTLVDMLSIPVRNVIVYMQYLPPPSLPFSLPPLSLSLFLCTTVSLMKFSFIIIQYMV